MKCIHKHGANNAYQKIKCEYCDKEIILRNYKQHLKIHEIKQYHYFCENCGKEVFEKYGSGRFCSNECAKSFSTKAKRKDINEKIKNALTKQPHVKKCKNCGNEFTTKLKNKKYCSLKCSRAYYKTLEYSEKLSKACSGKCGGYRENSGRGKQGWYDSIYAGRVYLQSSWELAYAKYLDENNIKWQRNTKHFNYFDSNNKEHYYVPDFYLEKDNLFIEIKGYKTELDNLKWKSIPNLKVLFKSDLKKINVL
jgi:ribosomal protein L37AE/L43A